MPNNLKRTNTLFHSCKKFESLKNIIRENGFRASYADELIENHEVKTLMVSFSNVALFESESQINYGKYAIGLTKEWGIKNELEPVYYTYENSITGNSFMENVMIAGRMKVRECINNPDLDSKITTLFDNSINSLEYLKSYIVTNQKGQEFIAYNDREWRYVHKHDKYNALIFKTNFLTGKVNSDYDKHKPYNKPYTEKAVLVFGLKDLKFIIVDKKKQKKIIYSLLFKAFGKENVMEKILDGEIDILSRDTIWNNL
ncbi:abortive infection system antitoxin AbiGi family protein [Winogradskyella helgolandensis]|uniref:abortive infection system antitoxin AbiGi family protein n=1 Tax=Winogradskyella helgolandensis TaxID=2697010 RepID=UPI0015BF32EC|nr:abortive infection system antitoxin AbiGi family protein [Winogradskyella helgolandensis]